MTDALTAVVLAGGRSRRFGAEDKLLTHLDGRPLVAHTVSTAASLSAPPPVVATRDRSHEHLLEAALDRDVRFVRDAPGFEGPLAGLVAARSVVETPWLFVCGGDMPLLSPAAVGALSDRTGTGADAVVPVVDGEIEPLHALYRRDALSVAIRSVNTDAGLHEVCRHLPFVYYPRGDRVSSTLARSITDVDTPTDFRRLTVTFRS